MILKKPISVIIAFFILVSNIGLAFNVHYCGKEIASISLKTSFLNQNPEKKCCGITDKKSACCKDKLVHFHKKTADSILKVSLITAEVIHLMNDWQPIVFCRNTSFKSSQITTYFCDTNAPPLFKLYHQYLYYA